MTDYGEVGNLDLPRYQIKDLSVSNGESRSSSAPRLSYGAEKYQTTQQQMTAAPQEPSFGTLERSLACANNMMTVDAAHHNKRSVQVACPENRVLFELTTISNDLVQQEQDLTTVYTSLVPSEKRRDDSK